MANLDSIGGGLLRGIRGRKVFYPVEALVKWVEKRATFPKGERYAALTTSKTWRHRRATGLPALKYRAGDGFSTDFPVAGRRTAGGEPAIIR